MTSFSLAIKPWAEIIKRANKFASIAAKISKGNLLFPVTSVVLIIIIWVLTGYLARSESRNGDKVSRIATDYYLQAYAAQAVRALREIDLTLKLVQYEYEVGDGEKSFKTLKQRDLLPSDLLFDVGVFDRNGALQISSRARSMSIALDSPLLNALQRDNAFVSAPALKTNAGDWVLRFGRSLHTRDGAFAGAVVVTVDADYFVSGYDPEQLGANGFLGLVGHDGIFRVSSTGNSIAARTTVADAAKFALELQRGWPPTLGYELDGTLRYVGVHELGAYPLAVVVAPSADEALAPSRNAVRLYLRVAAVATMLVLLFTAMLWRISWQLARARQRELEARIAHGERAEYMAHHDALTALPNRSLFAQRLAQSIEAAKRSGLRLAVLFIDLDHFKEINDTQGHDAGDALLKEVARRLVGCVRANDCVARLGGDEFVVLLNELHTRGDIETVAKKMVSTVSLPFELEPHTLNVTASIGISVYPDHGVDGSSLMKYADDAMYDSKRLGKNLFRFSPDQSGGGN